MSEQEQPVDEVIVDIADKVENKGKEFAGAAQEEFGNAVDSPKHQIKGAAKQVSAKVTDAIDDAATTVREQVRENPLIGLAAVGTIGLLLGFILGRK